MTIVKHLFFALTATVPEISRFAQLLEFFVSGQRFGAEGVRPSAMTGVD